MHLSSQIRVVSLIIPTALVISVVVSGVIAIDTIQAKLHHKLLQNESEQIINHLNSEYLTLERAGVSELSHYTVSSQQNFIKEVRAGEVKVEGDLIVTDSAGLVLMTTLEKTPQSFELQSTPASKKLSKLNINDNSYFYYHDLFEPWQWRVYLVLDEASMLHDRNEFMKLVVLVAIAILAVGLLFSYKVSQRLKLGVDSVVAFIKNIETGGASVLIPQYSKIEELKMVQRGLQQMEATIDERNQKLNEYRLNLEELVKERTEELRQKVEESLSEIENRRLAESELEKTRNHLSYVIDSMPSLIVGVDIDGNITQWNAEAVRQTDVSVENAIGQPLEIALPHLKTVLGKVLKAIETKQPQTISKRLKETDRARYYEEISVYPLVTKNGVDGAVIRVDDISSRVRLEELMKQNEKMSSIAGLAAGMAHEINNPLAAIMQGYQNTLNRINPGKTKNCEIAKKFNFDIADMHAYLDDRKILAIINAGRDACERAAQIVRNMLMFSRPSQSEVTMVDIEVLVEKTIELGSTDYDMKKKYDFKFVDIIREYDRDLPMVKCCPSEIEQVLLNLFKNALQAMEEIQREEYKPQFHVRLINEHNFLRIEVEDNGPGIPEHKQSRIFEPFFTSKQPGKGTGLGLSVSYSIITQNHSGSFEVESEEGVGTKFIICLPLFI